MYLYSYRESRAHLIFMVKDVAPCAPWGTKAPEGPWYRDEALGPTKTVMSFIENS